MAQQALLGSKKRPAVDLPEAPATPVLVIEDVQQ
jgi:hypothetical protein